ncbi:hypothetical protein NQZ68_007540, partial [Dissostichus eleginoides]
TEKQREKTDADATSGEKRMQEREEELTRRETERGRRSSRRGVFGGEEEGKDWKQGENYEE